MLAATALVHGRTVVTRNVKDVARTGAAVLSSFSGWRDDARPSGNEKPLGNQRFPRGLRVDGRGGGI